MAELFLDTVKAEQFTSAFYLEAEKRAELRAEYNSLKTLCNLQIEPEIIDQLIEEDRLLNVDNSLTL